MDQLEQYLESIRRGLDVRTDAERDEITAEIRDHILTLAERFEDDGVEAEAAIAQAVQQMGDERLIAARVSEAHDGGSRRQAWLAVAPIALSIALLFVGARLWKSTEAWPLAAAKLAILACVYLHISPRVPGRIWKMPWIATIISSMVIVLIAGANIAIAPEALKQDAFLNRGSGVPMLRILVPQTSPTPLEVWQTMFWNWASLGILGAMAVSTAVLLIRRKRWLYALLVLAPLSFGPSAVIRTLEMGTMASVVLFLPYGLALFLTLIYLVCIEEWKCSWTMGWIFVLALSDHVNSASITNEWHVAIIAASSLVVVGITLALYATSPRSRASSILATWALLHGIIVSGASYVTGDRLINFSLIIGFGFFAWIFEYYDRKFRERHQPLGFQ